MVSQILEQSFLPDIHAVLAQELCEISDQDGTGACFHRIREDFLRTHALDIFQQTGVGFFQLLDLLICHFQGAGKDLLRGVPGLFQINEVLTVQFTFFGSLDHADLFGHVYGDLVVNCWSATYF